MERLPCIGRSGRQYSLEVCPIGTQLNPVPGVYVFMKPAANGNWDAIYIGEAGDLNQRLNTALQGHHAWPSVRAHRATHLGLLVVHGDRQVRLNVETDLRQNYPTPCNQQ